MSDITPTRGAWLELREEREGMQEGYRFLDEKRLVLAAEILGQLKQYETLMSKYRAAYNEAARALKRAVARQGLIGLEHYPTLNCTLELEERERSLLGVPLREVEVKSGDSKMLDDRHTAQGSAVSRGMDAIHGSGFRPSPLSSLEAARAGITTHPTDGSGCVEPAEPLLASPEANKCRERFAQLPPMLSQLAATAGNLERLRQEYRRTARRARALEDVLLPEIAEDLERIDTALEEQEKEEAVRVKMMRG